MMGVVYEALDPSLHRTIALKVIRLTFAATDEGPRDLRAALYPEARVAAGLSHPGIVVVHDVDRDPETGVLYLALEYLPGTTLSSVIADGGRPPWTRGVVPRARVAEALALRPRAGGRPPRRQARERHGLPDGEPKILDFGLAQRPATSTPGWPLPGDAALHGAGAGPGPARRRPDRSLLSRRDPYTLVAGRRLSRRRASRGSWRGSRTSLPRP